MQLSKSDLKHFAKQRLEAVKRGNSTFEYLGYVFDVGFAKHLIEYNCLILRIKDVDGLLNAR